MVDICFVNKEEITGINLNNKEGKEKKQKVLAKLEAHFGMEFRNLIERMLNVDPKKRPEYDNILQCLEKIERDFCSKNSKIDVLSSNEILSGKLTDDGHVRIIKILL